MSNFDNVEVHVRAAGGNMLTDAKVTLVPRTELVQLVQSHAFPFETFSLAETNFSHDKQGVYKPKRLGLLQIMENEWFLIVTHTNFNPVIQPLTRKCIANGCYFTAKDGVQAATLDIISNTNTRYLGIFTQLAVDLHERNEVIMMTGTDYMDFGTPFRYFAETRRWELLKAGRTRRTNVGTLVTILSCDDRAIMTFVKAKPREEPLAWLQIHTALKGTLPIQTTIVPGKVWPDALLSSGLNSSFALSIVDLYKYLDKVGNRRPRTVSEVSIFSHAHIGGPILYNTFERPQYRGTDTRDPEDFDGRPKDFKPTSMGGWSKLPEAMSPNSNWHLWGCQASRRFVFLAGAGMKQSRPPGQLFPIGAVDFTGKVNLRYIRRTYGRILAEVTYPAAVAAQLNSKVNGFKSWGAPPGTGALLTGPGKKPNLGRWFLVSDKGNEFNIVINYLKKDPMFSDYVSESQGLDGMRYIDYTPFQSVSVPGPNPSPEIHEFDKAQEELYPYDWVYGHLGVHGNTQLTISPVKLGGFSKGSAVSGPRGSGTSVLYVLRGRNPDVGRVFAIEPAQPQRVTILETRKTSTSTTFNEVVGRFSPPPHSP